MKSGPITTTNISTHLCFTVAPATPPSQLNTVSVCDDGDLLGCCALSEVAYMRVVFLRVDNNARWSVISGLLVVLFIITCGPLSCCAIGLQLDHVRLIWTRPITLRVSWSARPGQLHKSYKTTKQGHWLASSRRRQSSLVACRWSCCRALLMCHDIEWL